MKSLVIACILALAFSAVGRAATSTPLLPALHGDFDHYTFALTWQPGICSTDEGCVAGQPRTPLIGLHGLWASRPQDLIRAGDTDPQWWSRGCDFYHHSSEAPPLDAALHQRLVDVMPYFATSLLTHEYDKHVQCFGFDPTLFFTTELAMRDAVVSSAFGAYLTQQAGKTVDHTAVVNAFDAAFSTAQNTSLQLQCGHDNAGRTVLTQFWITLHAAAVNDFPKPDAFMDTDPSQDSCPQTFLIPAWS